MRMKIKLMFDTAETEALNKFQTMINDDCHLNGEEFLSMEQLCKRSIFYAISNSYRRARHMKEQMDAEAGVTNGNATSGDTTGDNAETSTSEAANPTVEAATSSPDMGSGSSAG